MKQFPRTMFAALMFPLALHARQAAPSAPADDPSLRRAVVGTWQFKKNAGLASAAVYTIVHEDGTATQLVRMKVLFRPPRGILIENTWQLQDSVLALTPVNVRSQAKLTKVDRTTTLRRLLSVDGRVMRFETKGKQRTEKRVDDVPVDVRAMIEELARR